MSEVDEHPQLVSASVVCACCETPLPVGTRARSNPEGVIICVECFEALSDHPGVKS